MTVLDLAVAEAAAAARKNVAEAEWRGTWWHTSIALPELPDAESKAIIAELATILGCSTGWLASRRRTAAKIAEDLRDNPLLFRVPPRLAMEWVRGGERVLDLAAAEYLVQWEADERSLRELAGELGTAGRSWANKEQLDEREAANKPSVEQIRAALADPEIAREVVAHGPTRSAFQGATDSWARETTSHTQWTPPPTNVVHDDRLAQMTGDLMRARELIAEAHRISNDLPLDEGVANGTISRLEAVIAEATGMRDALTRYVTFSGELEQLGGVR